MIMKKVFHLSSCDTCQKIIKNTQVDAICTLQDIKKDNISAEDLDGLASQTGSYESLFSRKALKYRAMGLHEKRLTEADYRRLILEEYTFLKRPVIVIDDKIFVGNAPKVVQEAKEYCAKML
jgi:arsenate reductase-like glutaredoxin family protein